MLARDYFEAVRFPEADVESLRKLSERGFVVHVMRTTAWINYLYLDWALIRRGLNPIRAVVNLRRWFTRPFTRARMSGDHAERFEWAKNEGGSGLIFLRESGFNTARGVESREDPFPALIEMARKSDRPVYVVPELLVWEKWQQKVKPSLFDRVFGSPEAPGFLHTLVTFMRNYRRAQLRIGTPVDLREVIASEGDKPSAVIARKVRSALHHHLARETRAVFGPPAKEVDRLIDEAMRDKTFQLAVQEVSAEKNKPVPALLKDAKKSFDAIAARFSPTVVGGASMVLDWVFNRIYDGIEVDEAGLQRAMKAAAHAPVVFTPSHKSHLDYLIMSYVLWQRGFTVPLVAAGANLSFFPLGPFLRRCGAFFLRRSFKGDKLYTAVFKAYLKKLVHDGIHHEFFPEGGRSRTGKLLQPKLGLFTWLVEAVLEGARNDLVFIPIAIDYEKVVEGAEYKKELQGGEKKPEDLKALLSAPAVLAENYGRIHLTFDEPVSLAKLIADRGLDANTVSEDQKKALVRALGHRVMYGISKVSTVTPHALLASALLAHRRRGISDREVTERIVFLRGLATDLGSPLSRLLKDSPSSPTVIGPIRDAMRMFASGGMVSSVEARGERIFQVADDRRPELSFYKNTLVNLIAGRSIVCAALLASETERHHDAVRERARFLSRLFKLELVYPVGKTFEHIFDETLEHLARLGLLRTVDAEIMVAPEAHARPMVQFLAEMIRDLLESYLLVARSAVDVGAEGTDKKDFSKKMLEAGRADFLAGTITASEALSKTTLENAVQFLIEQHYLSEKDKRLTPGTSSAADLAQQIRRFVPETT
ncbi:MAG: glycerol-3-phosphate acyltransferase [Archangium gephyra]|uniref:Glycerol-3-phosphate acyltransferase n=1 Tax=Archangium gephyra TaxID=48 RepID=A0A2W5ULH1_9BACT|nr:MAG: glycerol-3-phosphate acyltransferase [Archangium gephyra]